MSSFSEERSISQLLGDSLGVGESLFRTRLILAR